ncbi:MAG: hypothetical protein ACW9W4_07815 [Candidatus Nitrosopumilus sp. bin_7KS]
MSKSNNNDDYGFVKYTQFALFSFRIDYNNVHDEFGKASMLMADLEEFFRKEGIRTRYVISQGSCIVDVIILGVISGVIANYTTKGIEIIRNRDPKIQIRLPKTSAELILREHIQENRSHYPPVFVLIYQSTSNEGTTFEISSVDENGIDVSMTCIVSHDGDISETRNSV